MGCQFCASTIAGYVRDLMPSELLLQIYETQRDAGCRIDSIVLMGIGEPLDNFENVVQFFRILSHPDGMQMSLRHVALSTCGLVPRIRQLADLRLGVTLSVSLHSPENRHRSDHAHKPAVSGGGTAGRMPLLLRHHRQTGDH